MTDAIIFTVTVGDFFGLSDYSHVTSVKAYTSIEDALHEYNSYGGEAIYDLDGISVDKKVKRLPVGEYNVITHVRLDAHLIEEEVE